ncbi:hypothetical protein [Candidatus Rhabdochlamydia sp. T3358]|uniref:hypothetical protein n=1 Tax=Candidatus Rhabdochlamydia sp. T3358 TaxID=2099795 RepID=UPI0010BBE1A6|nr:hypothetical protein [Candidatus Rhabdochlamydia sp. T3358]VHN99710.1 hypothetical protein RHT_00117 [Candidatus Rhabdochlamydia sp. T3358]
MVFPIGNPGQGNALAARYAGKEVKMAAAKSLVNQSLTTVKEVVTPALAQVVINNSPNIPPQNIQRAVNYSTNSTQNSIQRAANRSIESPHFFGDPNSSISRTTDWLFRR